MNAPRTTNKVLDLAQWARSRRDTQPSAVEVINDVSTIVRGDDARDHCLDGLDAQPGQLPFGALLGTASIAASSPDRRLSACPRVGSPPARPMSALRIQADRVLPAGRFGV